MNWLDALTALVIIESGVALIGYFWTQRNPMSQEDFDRIRGEDK